MKKTYPLPAEVKGLPPELAEVELTPKQKKKDEARRDELMKLAGSAARLSPAEAERAHAHTRVSNYQLQLDHLVSLREQRPKERGMTKRDLLKAIKTTALLLSEACEDTGDFAKAAALLAVYVPHTIRRPHLDRVLEVLNALAVPDDEHCECSTEHLTVRKTIRDQVNDREVALVHCTACGHMNATGKLPPALNALQQSRQVAKEGETDAHIFARIKVDG